jgi:hypothetical protein
VEDLIMAQKLFLSDDAKPFHEDDKTIAPAAESKTVGAAPGQFAMVDRWLGIGTASWDASELSELDAVCRMGGVPANVEPGGILSELRGPLKVGTSVQRFDLNVGVRLLDASDPPRQFLA